MTAVRITFKDGTSREFPYQNRVGGSYSTTVRYEGAFVIIKDEYGKETAFPAADVKEVWRDSHDRW